MAILYDEGVSIDGKENRGIREAYIEVPKLGRQGFSVDPDHGCMNMEGEEEAYLTSPVFRWFMSMCMPSGFLNQLCLRCMHDHDDIRTFTEHSC